MERRWLLLVFLYGVWERGLLGGSGEREGEFVKLKEEKFRLEVVWESAFSVFFMFFMERNVFFWAFGLFWCEGWGFEDFEDFGPNVGRISVSFWLPECLVSSELFALLFLNSWGSWCLWGGVF